MAKLILILPADTGLTLPDPISTLLAVPIPKEFWEAGDAIRTFFTSPPSLASYSPLLWDMDELTRQSPSKTHAEAVVEQAVREAKERGIRGKETTPFLLKRVSELTKDLKGGTSVQSNIGLIRHNTTIASQVAVELAKLKREGSARGEDDLVRTFLSPRLAALLRHQADADPSLSSISSTLAASMYERFPIATVPPLSGWP
jgi:hypothetical protein